MRRSRLSENTLAELQDMVDDINLSRIPILVEGNNDIDALRKIGIETEIIKLNSGSSVFNFCEALAMKYDEIILLLDWDRKGCELTNKIRRILESLGTRCILKYRRRLAELFPYVSSVEEISL